MPTHDKARALADAFEAAYPQGLPHRLDWWGQVLGIDRGRFLRMMGMSARDAADKGRQDWDTLLQDPRWRDQAWWLEGKLHELLSLFDYDWTALAERLHQQTPPPGAAEPSPVPRGSRAAVRLRPASNGHGADPLLNAMAGQGAESLSALFAYLAGTVHGTAHRS